MGLRFKLLTIFSMVSNLCFRGGENVQDAYDHKTFRFIKIPLMEILEMFQIFTFLKF